jgi:four helix bundle protein
VPEPIRTYRDLIVWQVGIELAVGCYEMTRSFSRDELYGLTSQIRRSSTSIPANIAEGYGRDSTGQFVQFLRIAQGSLKELETHLTVSERVQLLERVDCERLMSSCSELGRMLRALIRSLEPQ